MLLALLFDGTQPTDIWHDALFLTLISIAGTFILGIGTLVATYFITKKFSSPPSTKEVRFEVLSDLPLSFTKKKDKVELKVNDNQIVDDLSLVDIEIRNTGTRAVARNDYDAPIEFEFLGRKVLFCEVTNQKPPHILNSRILNTFFTIDSAFPEKVRLAKFLLNKGYAIRIQAVVSGAKGQIFGYAGIIDGNFDRAYPITNAVVVSKAFIISAIISLIIIIGVLEALSLILSLTTSLATPIIVLIVIVIFLVLLVTSLILAYRALEVRLQNFRAIA